MRCNAPLDIGEELVVVVVVVVVEPPVVEAPVYNILKKILNIINFC